MYKTLHEKIAETSRKDIEHISFLLDRYSKNNSCSFDDSLSYLMAEIGYKKYNYIPKNKDDLFVIGQLSLTYMRAYQIKFERFIQSVIDCHDYCIKYGYSVDTKQQTLRF